MFPKFSPKWSTHDDSPTSQAHLRQPDADSWYACIFPTTLLGHEHLDTTMIYTEVSDPLLRQDYYLGIATLDSGSENLSMSGLRPTQPHTLRQLIEELKTPGLEKSRHGEIGSLGIAVIKPHMVVVKRTSDILPGPDKCVCFSWGACRNSLFSTWRSSGSKSWNFLRKATCYLSGLGIPLAAIPFSAV